MPVTIQPSPELVGLNKDQVVHSSESLLRTTALAWSPAKCVYSPRLGQKLEPESRRIIQSSFYDLNPSSMVIPYGNGLVHGIKRAFQQDLHLVLRPDDIWLSILTQFSMFVNANAEHLRAYFVAHEGKKELVVDISPYPLDNIDMGKFAQEMTLEIEKNVVDVKLRDWIMPDYSTTTDNDRSVAAVVIMGAVQEYFDYELYAGCGFPSVTLLGERSDWEDILHRVLKLPKYGCQTTEWSQLLVPVLKHIIMAFDSPNSQKVKDFWLRACHSAGKDGYEDFETLSGWITAFCFWTKDGKRNRVFSDNEMVDHGKETKLADRKRLILDGIIYPIIHPGQIPTGVVSVPVIIKDLTTRLEHKTTMVAGSVGMTATSEDGGVDGTTVQPRSGWWMLEDSVKPIDKEQETSEVVPLGISSSDFDDCGLVAF
jgi:hypothetical protein